MNVLFVVNDVASALKVILPGLNRCANQKIVWSLSQSHDSINSSHDVVFLLSYRKIIDEAALDRVKGKVIVFHSSDLPEGRGWAPIYAAISSREKTHAISMCYAAPEVDAGNILAKARCAIRPNYTAAMLRAVGQSIISHLIGRYVCHFDGKKPPGMPQHGEPTYVARRTSKDGEIATSQKFEQAIPHLLASEKKHPAFFVHRGEKFFVDVIPENKSLDDTFTIEEYFDGVLGSVVTVQAELGC